MRCLGPIWELCSFVDFFSHFPSTVQNPKQCECTVMQTYLGKDSEEGGREGQRDTYVRGKEKWDEQGRVSLVSGPREKTEGGRQPQIQKRRRPPNGEGIAMKQSKAHWPAEGTAERRQVDGFGSISAVATMVARLCRWSKKTK